MALSNRQTAYLNSIIQTAQKLLESDEASERPKGKGSTGARRQRRSSEDAEKMRAQILASRAKGVSAAKLAEKYGVSTAYIYMMK